MRLRSASVGIDFYQFFLNTKILFQPGISRDFSNELAQLTARKFLLVTDPFFAENGVADAVRAGIEGAGAEVVGVFSEVPPNSEVEVVKRCAAAATAGGAEGIVALGGGSAMDTAKAANIVFSLGGDLVADYSGSQTIPRALNPLIAIPTTAGTGSEVTSSAVIFDEATQRKLSFNDAFLRPQLALLDPELTLSLPPKATAMTGMDALTHAIEAYTSAQANPMSDALAMKAVKLIRTHLLQAVERGEELEARSQMMIASNMAGIAFDHAMVGVVHAMSHATGGIAHVPHGLANSIYLPYGMEYNLEVAAERYAGLARRLGVDTSGMSPADAARAAVTAVREMRAALKRVCGLPDRLRDAGVAEGQLEEIAATAVEDGASFFNPREVTFDEVLKKIREAY
ncbi:MAG: iron-containing alcohol dehydrogenase [Deltaproteobacteria bacterium]|nr:iron-containing alcohol dehydrogenase [Deltaproteobacteria bacterium]